MSHIPDDIMDNYALGRLPEAESAAVEEHLLVCHECQDRLHVTDVLIDALREARNRTSRPKED